MPEQRVRANDPALPALTGISRRRLLKALPAAGVALAAPALAQPAARSLDDQVQYHAKALVELVRDAFPAEAARVGLTIGADLSTGGTSINATALHREWIEDTRLQRGGMWVERDLGNWAPGVGRF